MFICDSVYCILQYQCLSCTLLLTCKGGGSPSLSEDSWGVNCRTGVASVPSEHDMRIYLCLVTVNNWYIFHIFISNHVLVHKFTVFFLAYHLIRPQIPKIRVNFFNQYNYKLYTAYADEKHILSDHSATLTFSDGHNTSDQPSIEQQIASFCHQVCQNC
jgi:hypothetical protein